MAFVSSHLALTPLPNSLHHLLLLALLTQTTALGRAPLSAQTALLLTSPSVSPIALSCLQRELLTALIKVGAHFNSV